MSVPMPATVVLIVCRTILVGEPDQNAGWTGHENRQWDTTDSVMHCRRQEVSLYEMGDLGVPSSFLPDGLDPQPFNVQRCQRAGLMLGAHWNEQNKDSDYRFWRVACPVPVIDTRTGETIAWSMPDCGKRGKVVCERDTAI